MTVPMTVLHRLLHPKTAKAGGLVLILSALAACGTGTTYGTGKSTEVQLLESVGGLVGIKTEEDEPIVYSERAPLVVPGSGTNLQTPQTGNLDTNANWPQDPDKLASERRQQEREAEKINVLTDPNERKILSSTEELAKGRRVGGGKPKDGRISQDHLGEAGDRRNIVLSPTELKKSHQRQRDALFGAGGSFDRRSESQKRSDLSSLGDQNPVISQDQITGGRNVANKDGSVGYSDSNFQTGERRYLIEPPSKYREPARTETGEIVSPPAGEAKKESFFSKLNPF